MPTPKPDKKKPPPSHTIKQRSSVAWPYISANANGSAVARPDVLVPDPQVQREFGVCAMTLWRWDEDPSLGFPPPIKIKTRKYRSRNELEEFKQRLIRDAIAARGKGKPPLAVGAKRRSELPKPEDNVGGETNERNRSKPQRQKQATQRTRITSSLRRNT